MRKARWLPLFIVLAMLLGACGAAQVPQATPQTGTGETFMFALPRLVVDVDTAGNPSMFNINAQQLGRFINVDLNSLRLDAQTVNQMTANNVQHVELRQVGDGLVVLVNGKPMPHVGWSDDSLQRASDVAGVFGVQTPQNMQTIRRLLPIVRRLGLDVVLRFPRQTNQAEIAMSDSGAAVQVTPSTDPASAVLVAEVKYDQTGQPGMMGVTAADLAGLGLRLPGRIQPEVISRLQQANVQNLEVRGKRDGFYVYVNGDPLPNLIWDDALLKNATDLYLQVNPNNPNNDIMKLLIPFIGRTDVDVLFHFPIANGQPPLPARMHP